MSKTKKPITQTAQSVSETTQPEMLLKGNTLLDTVPTEIESRPQPFEEQAMLTRKQTNAYNPRVREAQARRYLQLLEECGNPVTAADLVGVTLRTIMRWRQHSGSFSKKYDESLRIGELNIEHQLAGKMDSEALSKPFDKVTGVLSMFRMKKLNPQYKDTQQVNVNVAGPAALQFVISGQNPTHPQDDTTTGSGSGLLENA